MSINPDLGHLEAPAWTADEKADAHREAQDIREEEERCYPCKGTGRLPGIQNGTVSFNLTCPECNGAGRVARD